MAKWYIVWEGRKPGIYETWAACKAQVDGYKGARFKSFKDISKAEAEEISRSMDAPKEGKEQIYPDAIAVDASCIGNPGKMEYRGVVVETGDIVFQSKVYPKGTNNIGEFLAIVHAMALMQQQGYYQPIYSDSVNALLWISQRKCKTQLPHDATTAELFSHVARAEQWLQTADLSKYKLLKWDKTLHGEIPADYGRK